jgi:3'-phosphoadenosine 5'-phosphosulfate sulfotransferase (PAPS reductase)/FAD synthetase
MNKYISFSGGVESTTMCILYGKGAKAIWCDTGWEHDVMYQRIDDCEKRLKEIHDGDFELIRVKPNVTARGIKVSRVQDYIRQMMFMPSGLQRYCTNQFKIAPIEKMLKNAGECELMLGFNADEEPGKIRLGNLEKLKNVKYTYPLFDAGYDRDMCEDILRLYGLHPDFPVYMKRGGCVGCIFKSVPEFKAMYFFSRSEFDENLKLENEVQDKRKRFFTLSMSQKPFQVIADECEREIQMWGRDNVEKMYQKVKPGQSCGPFCQR